MPHPLKFFLNNSAVFITTRTQEGIPFTCAPFITLILESIFARAQLIYPVRIFAFQFMGNHLHLGIVVTDPEIVPLFMKYVKSESAGAINRLLGRSAKHIWEEGYDSPIILDANKCMEKIVYMYLNPTEANLVDRIEDYPGFSSWKAFSEGHASKKCPWVRRKRIPKLPKKKLTISEQSEFFKYLRDGSQVSFPLTIEPNAWMECFPELEGKNPSALNQTILMMLRGEEKKLRLARKTPVMGAKKLISEEINKHYLPKTRGRRSWCISSDTILRKEFIAQARVLFADARATYQRWKNGDFSLPYPPGLFPPPGIYRANILRLGVL